MKICFEPGCNNQSYSGGRCVKHHRRFQRHGDANIARPLATTAEIDAFLKYAICYNGDDCLLWPFGKGSHGYGAMKDGDQTVLVHDWICEKLNGPREESVAALTNPEALIEACHDCGIRLCINPGHLRWDTRLENTQDSIKHGTWAHGESNGMVTLSTKDMEQIRKMYATGSYWQRELAEMFDITRAHVSRIINFRRRRNG